MGKTAKTVVPDVKPLPPSGPDGVSTHPVGVPKQKTFTRTRSSTSKSKEIPCPGSSKAPLLQPVSASEGQSYNQSEPSTAVEEKDLPQSSTVKGKALKIPAKRKQQQKEKSHPNDSKLAKLGDEIKSGKGVAEKSDAKSPPNKKFKICPTVFREKRLLAREKLCAALRRGCEAGNVLVTVAATVDQVADEIELSLYSLYNQNCVKKYKENYQSLLLNIGDPKNVELSRKIMERKILPGKVYIVAFVILHSLVLFVGFNVYFFMTFRYTIWQARK